MALDLRPNLHFSLTCSFRWLPSGVRAILMSLRYYPRRLARQYRPPNATTPRTLLCALRALPNAKQFYYRSLEPKDSLLPEEGDPPPLNRLDLPPNATASNLHDSG